MNLPTLHSQALHASPPLRNGWASAQKHSADFSCASEVAAAPSLATAHASVWRESLAMVERHVPFGRRWYSAGEQIFGCGQVFDTVYLVGTGLCKEVNLAADGREQTADLHFRGDWLGFDGIPTGNYHCSMVALERSEVWSVEYPQLLQAASREATLMRAVLAAMSSQMIRSRDALLSMGTLNAEARVGGFLLQWALALQERGQRTDLISVTMTRADIGNHLGMRVESVSRALTKIAQSGAIQFNARTRRQISIPSLSALQRFVRRMTDSEKAAIH